MLPDRTNTFVKSRETNYDPGLRMFFRDVYNLMVAGLVTTGLVAYGVAHSPVLLHALFGNPVISIIVMLSPIAFSLFLNSSAILRMSTGAAMGSFLLFSAVLGLSLSVIFIAYTSESIARVFFISAIMFGGMSIYGYTTKRNLDGMGSLMIMGAWGVFIAFMINIFMHSNALSFVASVIGVIVYTGLIGWNTQFLKQAYRANAGLDANRKLATIGALRLYIDFINIFMMLLRLMGGGSRR